MLPAFCNGFIDLSICLSILLVSHLQSCQRSLTAANSFTSNEQLNLPRAIAKSISQSSVAWTWVPTQRRIWKREGN